MPGGNDHVENLGLDLNYWVRIFRLCLCITLCSLCNPIIPKLLKTQKRDAIKHDGIF